MFKFPGSVILIALVACLASSCATAAIDAPATRPVVVVELFTSEGCSSCPPADAVTADLAKPDAVDGIEIIPLAMHVDYWNHLGWADRFSSSAYSDRQQAYARWLNLDRIYTPQMIVDGREEFVGSDRRRAVAAIRRAAVHGKGHVIISIAPDAREKDALVCNVSVEGLLALGNTGADVLAAVTEDDLASDVERGENAGRTLRHAAVVRSLERIATIRAADALPFPATTKIALQSGWRTNQLHVAVFVQDPATGRILAAGQARPFEHEQKP